MTAARSNIIGSSPVSSLDQPRRNVTQPSRARQMAAQTASRMPKPRKGRPPISLGMWKRMVRTVAE